MRIKTLAILSACAWYIPVNLWYPGRDEYHGFTELRNMFEKIFAKALGGKE